MDFLLSGKIRRIYADFGSRLQTLQYRKLFIIAMEGSKTEPQYFSLFNNQNYFIKLECISSFKSSPKQVLAKMKKRLAQEDLRKSDEAWLVVDKDQWDDIQLAKLHAWSLQHENYGFALTNPKFEFWLLLHFEDGDKVNSSRECSERLKKYLPDYDKAIDQRKFTDDMVFHAIERAKKRDLSGERWPITFGSTVYKLVETILKSSRK